MEHVRLFEIVELPGAADEIAGGEAALTEVAEEDIVRHQARHRHHRPARAGVEALVELIEVGHTGLRQPQDFQRLPEGTDGAAAQQFGLAREQRIPDPMILGAIILPALRDGPVGGDARRRHRGGQRAVFRRCVLLLHLRKVLLERKTPPGGPGGVRKSDARLKARQSVSALAVP